MWKLLPAVIAAALIVAVNLYIRRKPVTKEEEDRNEHDRFWFQP